MKRCSRRTLLRVCAARSGGLCAATLRCTWLRPPAGTALWLFSYFSPNSHKRFGELLHSLLPCLQLCASPLTHRLFQRTGHICCPPVGFGVRFCSYEPGAGLRRPLMCCWIFSVSLRSQEKPFSNFCIKAPFATMLRTRTASTCLQKNRKIRKID